MQFYSARIVFPGHCRNNLQLKKFQNVKILIVNNFEQEIIESSTELNCDNVLIDTDTKLFQGIFFVTKLITLIHTSFPPRTKL